MWTAHAERWCVVHSAYISNTAETGAFADASEATWSDIYANNVGGATITGTSSGTNLTVTTVNGLLATGQVLVGPSAFGTATPITIQSQSSGTTGGPGVYVLSASANVASPSTIFAIGNSCANSGTHTVNNPGGGGASQTNWLPCPAGMWVRNVTNVNVSNSAFTKGSYYGMVLTGVRHSSLSNIVATNNSEASTGTWDDIHFDLNTFLANGYGEVHAVSLVGATVGANGQSLSSTSLSISPPTSRYGIFINDGLPGSMGDASIAAGGTGYAFNNSLSCSGGTSTEICKFTVAAAPGGIIALLARDVSGGSGVYTVLPANPVSLTGGAGTGATVNITWSSAYITGINCGQTVTACTRVPSFSTNWTVQTSP